MNDEIEADVIRLVRESGQLAQAGKYKQAMEIAIRANNLALELFGNEDRRSGFTLFHLGSICRSQGDFKGACKYLRKALKNKRNAVDTEPLHYVAILNNLGDLYREIGKYSAAKLLLERALSIERNAPTSRPELVATTLIHLGVLHRESGNFMAAESCHLEAHNILKRVFDPRHPDPSIVVNMGERGILYQRMGEYGRARKLLQEVLDIDLKIYGPDHPNVAAALTNLACVDRDIGDYGAFRCGLLKALKIQRKIHSRMHPYYAANLNELGALYRDMGKLAVARRYLRTALEIRRVILPQNHPAIATSLCDLAALCKDEGNYEAADKLYKDALDVRYNAQTLADLGLVHHFVGDYVFAERCYRQSLTERSGSVGRGHPHMSVLMFNLAGLLAVTGRPEEALEWMTESADIENRVLDDVFNISSEQACLAHLRTLRGNLACFLSLTSELNTLLPKAVSLALDHVLVRKGLTADALAALRKEISGEHYEELSIKSHELSGLKKMIERAMLDGPGPEGPRVHRRQLAVMQEKVDELQRYFPKKLHRVVHRDLAPVLPVGAALVEIIQSEMLDFKAIPARPSGVWRPARYLAFILHSGHDVQFVDLGEAKLIDQKISDFRGAITGGGRGIKWGHDSENQKTNKRCFLIKELGLMLREAVFDPLLPALKGCQRLFICPDGDISWLPFETLPLDDVRFVIDDYVISYLNTGRDILRFGEALISKPSAPIVAGDPDYDFVGNPKEAQTETVMSFQRYSRDLDRNKRFEPLGGAFEEGKSIAKLLGVAPLLREQVLERHLKEQRSPWILHLATHGCFQRDQEWHVQSATDGNRLAHLAQLENPLLRSFLALSGVNNWLAGRQLTADAEDGMLNAEDVSDMDLCDTELIVLSACETGLGENHVGEGVFGLRRAFVLAGARTLVMSLWKVPDDETRQLMDTFYRLILDDQPLPRAEALRKAQLGIKQDYPDDPLYWGAFICQGDPGLLQHSGS